MRWIWIPAGLAASLAALLLDERPVRAPRHRASTHVAVDANAAGDSPTPEEEPCANDVEEEPCAEPPYDPDDRRGDYVVAGRVVDSAGRVVTGATAYLGQASG